MSGAVANYVDHSTPPQFTALRSHVELGDAKGTLITFGMHLDTRLVFLLDDSLADQLEKQLVRARCDREARLVGSES